MKDDSIHTPTLEDNQQNTSQQSDSSGTTGLGSFQMTDVFQDIEMEEEGHTKAGSVGVEQGSSNLPPHALHTSGGGPLGKKGGRRGKGGS